jgi:hypothetical protein
MMEDAADDMDIYGVHGYFDRMRYDPKYRPVVKKGAEKGDALCIAAMELWHRHVKDLRRSFAGR